MATYMPRLDFAAVNAAALAGLPGLLAQWFPAGRTEGREYCVGSLHGEAGDSLKINTESGAWKDFATGEAGGDPIALYAAIHRLSQPDAARQLGEMLGLETRDEPAPAGPAVRAKWDAAPAAPAGAPVPDFRHFKHGTPARTWTYMGAAGELLGYIARFNLEGGGKEILPLAWAICTEAGYDGVNRAGKPAGKFWRQGDGAWRWLSFPKPRPLYRLDVLAAKPAANVVVVEGEKAADAAQGLFPMAVATTWPGGAQAVKYADWSPLRGRKVLLWPDWDRHADPSGDMLPPHEQPGLSAMLAIAATLERIGCQVRIAWAADVATSDGWDAADAAAEGWTPSRAVAWLPTALRTPAACLPAPDPTESPLPDRADDGEPPETNWREELLWKDESNSKLDSKSLRNVMLFLEHHPDVAGTFAFCEFSNEPRIAKKPFWDRSKDWTPRKAADYDAVEAVKWLEGFGLRPYPAQTKQAILAISRYKTVHPVREYLDGLPAWDGVGRLDQWLTYYFGVLDTPYARVVGRRWLISAIARIYNPGCKVEGTLILEGRQGLLKSTACSVLTGKQWFTDELPDLRSKDSAIHLHGRWVVEIAELKSIQGATVETVKSFLTRTVDRYRPLYAAGPVDVPRQTVFVGTTNLDAYLQDDTGARRFWPVECHSIDLNALERDRDQIWAEARRAYKAGEVWHIGDDDPVRPFAEIEQSSRHVGDVLEVEIAKYIRGRKRVSLYEIMEHLVEKRMADWKSRSDETRIGACMKRIGWKKDRKMKDGERGTFYEPPYTENIVLMETG